jgi:sugar/nucleoside kinase (ribokinase family)
MNVRSHDVVVCGYLCVDLTPVFPKAAGRADVFRPGSLIEVKDLSISLGGVVANTGLALNAFDQRVFLMGLVGKDLLGEIALKLLRETELPTGVKVTDKSSTAYSIVLSPPDFDRIFFESPGCNNSFTSSDIDYEEVAASRIFHFGYPPLMEKFYVNSGQELVKVFSRVKTLNVLSSLDMTLPDFESESGKVDWRSVLKEVLPFVDIFCPSLEELVFMMRPELYLQILKDASTGDILNSIPSEIVSSIGKELIDFGVRVALLKSGKHGAYLFTGDVRPLNQVAGIAISEDIWNHCKIRTPAQKLDTARVVNSSGAGDAAIAGLLTAVLKGCGPEAALKYASCAGRDNLYGVNATDGLADWETMTRELGLATF